MLANSSNLAAAGDGLMLAASLLISLSAAAVLSAVAMNFILARLSPGRVQHVRKSPVATLSMLGFFIGIYLLVHYRILTLDLELGPARLILIIIGTLMVEPGGAGRNVSGISADGLLPGPPGGNAAA
jgi:SNF family Na+-dependent transporter